MKKKPVKKPSPVKWFVKIPSAHYDAYVIHARTRNGAIKSAKAGAIASAFGTMPNKTWSRRIVAFRVGKK